MQSLIRPFLYASLLAVPALSQAEHIHHAGPAAPIGIMGYHLHPEGDWMMSYSYMQMDMAGNRDGTDAVSTPLPGYMISPLSMDMDMHMLGVMTGYSDSLTLMAMLPVMQNKMTLLNNMNSSEFSTESSGIGDVKLSAIMPLNKDWLASLGFNLPTGSISTKDVTPMSSGASVQLPYPMQLGSGSVELSAGLIYVDGTMEAQWGNKLDGVIRLNDNNHGYRLGNYIQFTSWYSRRLNHQSSVSLRFKLQSKGNISGAETAASVNPAMVPTADPDLRGGTRADILLGFNYQLNQHYLLGVEMGVPVYQNLDGPQLEVDSILQLGLQYDF